MKKMRTGIHFTFKFLLTLLWAVIVFIVSILNIYALSSKVSSFTQPAQRLQLTTSIQVLNKELGYIFYIVCTQALVLLAFAYWPILLAKIKKMPEFIKTVLTNFGIDFKYYVIRFRDIPVKSKILKLLPLVLVTFVLVLGKYIVSNIIFPKALSSFPEQQAVNIPLDTTIEFVFDTPMNKASVEKAFRINPAIEGTFEWEANQKLIFVPKDKLAKNTNYKAYLTGTVFSENFLPLLTKPTLEFVTIGNPKVIVASPLYETIEDQTPIMIIFDRPMIPLTTIDAKNSIDAPLKIEPAIEGVGRWLGTTAYQFIPTKSYNKSTKYTVTVFAGIKSQDDGILEEPYVWTFSSMTPQVIATYPVQSYSYANPFGSLLLTFNQKVDIESLKTHFTLTKQNLSTIQSQAPITGTFFYDTQVPNAVRFKPASPLERGQTYTATINNGLKGFEGPETMISDYMWTFGVSPLPFISRTTPANGEQSVEKTYEIMVDFGTPMDSEKISDYIKVFPSPKEKPIVYYSDYAQNAFINTQINRATKYTVTVLKGAPDQYGSPLPQDYVFTFETASYKPNVTVMPAESYFAVLNKKIPSRIVAMVTNANRVDYSLRKLNLDEFLYLYKLRAIYTEANKICGRTPECYNWQNYDYKKLPTVNEWNQDLDIEQNVPTSVVAKVTKKDGSQLDAGLYFLNIQIPTGAHDNIVFLVTETNLTTKLSPNQAFVWAVNQSTGSTINNMNIKVITYNNQEIASGKTNNDGVWMQNTQLYDPNGDGSGGPNDYLIIGEKDGDFTLNSPTWNSGINGTDFGLGSYYYYYGSNDDYKLYLTLDNPIFRPKDTVRFKGVIKKDSDGKFQSLNPGEQVTVTINDANGTQIYSANIPTNSNGSFFGETTLSESAALGMYNMTATYKKSSYSQSFQVEEYRKPEFSFNISTDKDAYISGDTAAVLLNTSYYFGAPLSDTSIKWSVKRNDYYFVWNKDSTYSFNNDDYYYDWWASYEGLSSQEVTAGTGISDSAGNLKINLPLNISAQKMAQRYSIEAETQDQSNQVISGSHELIVYKGKVFAGLKPASYVNKTGDATEVKVVTINTDGKELKDQEVNVKFYKRTWETVKEKNPDNGLFYYVSKSKDKLVKESDVTTNEDGYTSAEFTPEEGGVYKVVSAIEDSSGNQVKASTYIWVTGSGFESERANNDKITLRTDKIDYFSGEDASVIAASPYEKSYKTLYTLERANVLDYFVSESGGTSEPLTFKIKDTYSPNVYVSAVISKPGTGLKDPPEIKVGYTKVNVINKTNKLVLKTSTDKDMYHPGDQMNLSLEVKDLFGNPVKTELLVGVVDQAVWDLSAVQFGKIYDTFYKERPLLIQTSNNLTISMDRVNANTDLGSKGGSGGGGGGGFFDTSRKDFLTTAYWNPLINTDSNGKASVSVKLPDNLTKWRIVVYANTAAGGFGEIADSTVVTKDLLIRPFLPKFLATGDKAELGAIVMNRTNETKNGTIELKANGLNINGLASKQISVEPGKQVKVTWNTENTSTNDIQVGLGIRNTAGEVLDAIELTLPTFTYYTKETTAVSGQVNAGISEEKVLIPDNIVKDLGKLDISLSPNLGIEGFKALNYLATYPYECSEQISSKLVTYLTAYQTLNNYGLTEIEGIKKDKLEILIADAVQKLVYRQSLDGGWSWWTYPDGAGASNPFISAYVYNALSLGKKQGFNISDQTLAKAESFLRAYVASLNTTTVATKCNQYNCDKSRELNYLQPYIFSLFDNKTEFSSYVNNLWQKRYELSIESRAYLTIVMNQIPGMQTNANQLKNELLSMVKKSNTLSHWEERTKTYSYYMLSTDTTTTAAVLNMLVSTDKNNPLISETVRYLIGTQRSGYWYNTRDTATVFKALANYLESTQSFNFNQTYTTSLNGTQVGQGKITKEDLFKVFSTSLEMNKLAVGTNSINIKKEGTGTLFYNMNLEYYLPTDIVKPVEQGFTILREYFDMNGTKIDVSNISEGSEFWVKLTVVTPELRRNVVIEDKLPAGLEAVNNSLKNSGILNTENPTFMKDDSQSYYFYHKEFRDNKTALFADYLPAGVYETTYKLRATTPGIYHLPAAEVYEMYTPDVLGHTDGGWMRVNAN